jgi:dTMP kinase
MSAEVGTAEPRPHPHPGFFLVLEGPDGGGKTTQAGRLAGWLRERGLDVVTCRDPGGTALGNRLRGILLDRDAVAISLRAEMLLYMASRAQLVEEIIRPALEAGRVVISDRFSLSNIVYQGYAGGLGVQQVDLIGQTATDQLQADLTLILDVPPEVAKARVRKARDRMEDRPEDYHRRVRDGFLIAARDFAARESRRARESGGGGIVVKLDDVEEAEGTGWTTGPFSRYPYSPIVVIDATADPDAVFERIKTEVERALALDPRP